MTPEEGVAPSSGGEGMVASQYRKSNELTLSDQSKLWKACGNQPDKDELDMREVWDGETTFVHPRQENTQAQA